MVRRDFLKLTGIFSAVMAATAVPSLAAAARPLEAELNGRYYRGTADGKIYVSDDAGQSWALHSQFGTHLSIRQLSVDTRRRLAAVLDCAGYDFRLTLSSDSRTWRTA
jgi:hypothetical protein